MRTRDGYEVALCQSEAAAPAESPEAPTGGDRGSRESRSLVHSVKSNTESETNVCRGQ